MKIEKMLLTPNPYSRPQIAIGTIKNIIIHWVGNAGSSAINNRNYFENLKTGNNNTYASSHYIIGLKGEIIQCIPENEVAYHANSANNHSIGIENCHPDWEGKLNAATYASLIDLCVELCKRYNLSPETALLRHYDITGKDCPKYYVRHIEAWKQLKKDVANALSGLSSQEESPVTTTKIELNGQIKQVQRILYNGNNYIKLRDLADEHITIGYNSSTKTPIITTK